MCTVPVQKRGHLPLPVDRYLVEIKYRCIWYRVPGTIRYRTSTYGVCYRIGMQRLRYCKDKNATQIAF
jgi:hypothetical protein